MSVRVCVRGVCVHTCVSEQICVRWLGFYVCVCVCVCTCECVLALVNVC